MLHIWRNNRQRNRTLIKKGNDDDAEDRITAGGIGAGRHFDIQRRRRRADHTGAGGTAPTADNAVMLTIFLKHDQSRPLGELNAQLTKQGFYKAFPPAGIEVVSWYVMMGIGQVVTLRLPASRLREVNRIFETTAWGVYRTEFYPTYDYKAIGTANHDKAQ
jgi:hypothetical protein